MLVEEKPSIFIYFCHNEHETFGRKTERKTGKKSFISRTNKVSLHYKLLFYILALLKWNPLNGNIKFYNALQCQNAMYVMVHFGYFMTNHVQEMHSKLFQYWWMIRYYTVEGNPMLCMCLCMYMAYRKYPFIFISVFHSFSF